MPVFTSSIEVTADYPTIKPSLNLNFARSRALDPRISFGRTHNSGVVAATYIGRDGQVKRAGANEPRFDHDYDTLESLGLLIEEGRTNFCGDAIPSVADWTKLNNGTISFGFPAPDGTNTACRYVGSSTAPASLLRVGLPAFTTGTDVYTVSFWVKQVVANTQTGQNLVCDLHDGGPSVNYSDQLVQDKWVRVVQTGTTTSGTKTFFDMISNTLNNGTYDFWGLQIEQGDFATSLILTTDSTIGTRGPDEGNITGSVFSSFFNTTEGVIQTEFSRIGSVNNQMVVQFKDSDGSERIEIRGQGSSADSFRIEVIEGGATSSQEYGFQSSAVVANVVGQFAKVNLAYKQNDFASTINGTIASTDTSGDVGVCDRVGIGYANYGGRYNGHIKNIIYYPKRLTNAQLQLLTA